MTRIDEKDVMHLAAMRKYLRLASLFVDGMSLDEFMDDSSVQAQLATAMAIAQVGEHVKKLSPQLRAQEDAADWRAIAGTRDWLVHRYDDVDLEILYDSIVNEVPELMSLISSLLEEHAVDFTSSAELETLALPMPSDENSGNAKTI